MPGSIEIQWLNWNLWSIGKKTNFALIGIISCMNAWIVLHNFFIQAKIIFKEK